jgi:hypothetical protein
MWWPNWRWVAFTARGVHTGAGTSGMHSCGGQVIHPHRVLIERRCEGGPPPVLTQTSQHDCETVIGEIDALNRLPDRAPKGPKPLRSPGFNMPHAVVTPG